MENTITYDIKPNHLGGYDIIQRHSSLGDYGEFKTIKDADSKIDEILYTNYLLDSGRY